MATIKNTTTKKTTKNKEVTRQDIITKYMEYVLEHDRTPKSVFKFAKDNNMTEAEFYSFFGSFEGLRKEVWNTFFTMTLDVAHKSEDYHTFSNREKMLTFFYTFFELLTLNRSYVLFTLQGDKNMMNKMSELKGLRCRVKDYATELIQDRNESKSNILLERSERLYSEGAWVQMLFLLKFWMEDDSAGFEKTDMAIEKSVNTIFDVFDNTPLDAILDFGKFLWKERRA